MIRDVIGPQKSGVPKSGVPKMFAEKVGYQKQKWGTKLFFKFPVPNQAFLVLKIVCCSSITCTIVLSSELNF